ncbi:MAG: DUF433 domain-containing protein [Planctomycetes bacterium]|nr:DUF433 domain-containing protein [Planctomycetota bacterium]
MFDHDTLLKRITVDANTCAGAAVFRNTRTFVATVLASLADGMTADEIIDHFPQLKKEDVAAAVAYAIHLIGDKLSGHFDETGWENAKEYPLA